MMDEEDDGDDGMIMFIRATTIIADQNQKTQI